jgi:hypothetical protein
LVADPPASDVDNEATPFTIEGQASLQTAETPTADLQVASPEFSDALKIFRVASGAFSQADRAETRQIAVISQSMAARFWPKSDPLRPSITLGEANSFKPWLNIVGVVADAG